MALRLVRRSSLGWPAHPNVGTAACRSGMVVHYDGSRLGLAAKSHSACVAYWKSTRTFHMGPQRGWSDIGYSFGVCPHGYAFEGRGYGYQQAAQPGGNSTWTSCTFMTGDGEQPTPAQLQAFRELRTWLHREHGVGTAIKGHQGFISTSCPGTVLMKLVRNSRSPLYTGTASASTPTPLEKIVEKMPLLKLGDEGEDVETLQYLLMARSHAEVKPTGKFDAATRKAVGEFQDWLKIEKDHLVGDDTWFGLITRKKP